MKLTQFLEHLILHLQFCLKSTRKQRLNYYCWDRNVRIVKHGLGTILTFKFGELLPAPLRFSSSPHNF